MPIAFAGYPVYDAAAAAAELRRHQRLDGLTPDPACLGRLNSFRNPLGRDPARGLFLVRRADLDRLDPDADVRAVFDDGLGHAVTLNALVITREPQNLVPAGSASALLNSLYLVEVADRRWLVENPVFRQSLNRQFNVRAPGWGGDYYADSTNGGTAWTWQTMVSTLWDTMSGQLGLASANATLPFTPHGTPEGWRFVGVGAWESLCQVLDRVGCAVRYDPTRSAGAQYSVVRVGSADSHLDALLARAAREYRLVHDEQYLTTPVRGRLPYGVRVYFHYLQQHYGTAPDTAKNADQPTTDPAYAVAVAGPETDDAEPGVYHPLWDDLPAIIDFNGNLTNAAALAARAQERADDYYRRVTSLGGGRVRQVYAGVLSWHPAGANLDVAYTSKRVVLPGSTLREVTWRQELGRDAGEPGDGGLVTEVMRYPLGRPGDGDEVPAGAEGFGVKGGPNSEGNVATQPPDLAPEEMSYPPLTHAVLVTSLAASGGYYPASLVRGDPLTRAWEARESVWAWEINGRVPGLERHLGRLAGYANSRPVYEIVATCCDSSPSSSSSSSSSSGDTIAGWGGEGWYCVEDTGPDDCVAVELLEEDATDPGIAICSGPYGTLREALNYCEPGGLTIDLVTVPCSTDGVPELLKATFSSCTGDLAPLEGVRVTIEYAASPDPGWYGCRTGVCDGGDVLEVLMGCSAPGVMIVGYNGFLAACRAPGVPISGHGVAFTNPPFSLTDASPVITSSYCVGSGSGTAVLTVEEF